MFKGLEGNVLATEAFPNHTMNRPSSNEELRPFWRRFFHFNGKFGLVLLAAICVPRFWLVLEANKTGNYGNIGAIMIVSAIVPLVFLSSYGRKKIGIKPPSSYRWLLYSFVLGILISTFLFGLGYWLYGTTVSNWYVYIGRSYSVADTIAGTDRFIYFLIFAVTGMTFSPIGEELFFRGLVHAAFETSVGTQKASILDGFAFALTHLAHFGIVYISGIWKFLPVPAVLWVVGMLATSLVFTRCKQRTGSILGAIVSHAGFNFAMIYFIFYHL